MREYDWEQILSMIKSFARIDDISEIILLGDKEGEGQGIRRIKLRDD